jgi:hypothetical protein
VPVTTASAGTASVGTASVGTAREPAPALRPSRVPASGSPAAWPARRENDLIGHVLASPGAALPLRTAQYFGGLFGHDLGSVRVHTDADAARSARSLGARAYSAGPHVAFGEGEYDPASAAGRAVLGHELAHVSDWMKGGSRPVAADAAVAPDGTSVHEPVIHLLHLKDRVPLGEYEINMTQMSRETPSPEWVLITFRPDRPGPVISFLQIATVDFADPSLTWGTVKPADQALDSMRTSAGDAPPGQRVEPGASVDVDPTTRARRKQPSDPNVSPEYEHVRKGWQPGRAVAPGRNPGSGGPDANSVTMEDTPSLGVERGKFRFESSAFATGTGVFYGGVRWGFTYSPLGNSGEWAEIHPDVSPTFRAAIAAFNRYYKNRHVVRAGETLRSLSRMYFQSDNAINAIYRRNASILNSDLPDAPLPAGASLDMPLDVWDRARLGPSPASAGGKQNAWSRARQPQAPQ